MNTNCRNWFCVSLIATTLTWANVGLASTDWQPQLVPTADGQFRSGTNPIRLYLPPDIPDEVLQTLALEIDDIDVTPYVQSDGKHVVYTPVQTLTPGMHRVRIVEYADDGSIIERGSWELEVRQSATFRQASASVRMALEVSQRFAQKRPATPQPSRLHHAATTQLDAQLANEDWQATIKLPVIYNNQATGNNLDVGDFRFDWSRHGVTAVIGHQVMGADNLILGNFNRRGISLGYQDPNGNLAFNAFGARGGSINGIQHGLGISDPQDRISGGQWTYYPVRKKDALWALSGTYVTGKAPEAGTTSTGSVQKTGGDAWTLSSDSLTLQNRLRVRAEYAQSRYDFDGTGGTAAENANAITGLITYQPWTGKKLGGSPADWMYGAEYRRIGSFFRSPANPGAANDRQMTRVFSQLSWKDLVTTVQLAQESDNVDGISILPRQRARTGTLSFSYNPQIKYNDQGEPQLGLLGQQSYSLILSRELVRTTKDATATDNVDKKTSSVQAAASFTYTNWNWGITHAWIRINDNSLVRSTPTAASSLGNSSTLNASFPLLEGYTLSSAITHDNTRYFDKGFADRALDVTLNLDAILIPNKLTANLSYGLNHSWASNDSSNVRTKQGSANLTWHVFQAKGAKPGLALSLDASYGRVNDAIDPTQSSTNYQAFLKARVDWAHVY